MSQARAKLFSSHRPAQDWFLEQPSKGSARLPGAVLPAPPANSAVTAELSTTCSGLMGLRQSVVAVCCLVLMVSCPVAAAAAIALRLAVAPQAA